jgi:hypothetical protein
MKKVFYIVCIAFMTNACEKNIIDGSNYQTAPERLFRSYINSFVKCEKLDVSYSAGLEINDEKKYLLRIIQNGTVYGQTLLHMNFFPLPMVLLCL